MARHYRCTACGYQKETQAMRGPVPLKCDDCKADPVNQKLSQSVVIRNPDRRSIEALENVTRAIEMRRDFKTWAYIANELGYSSPEAAHQAAKLEMAKRTETLAETIDDFREKSISRLEHYAEVALKVLNTEHLLVNAGKVVRIGPEGEERALIDDGPTLAAIDRLVKINESARKLLGADAATKTEASVNIKYTVEGIVESDMP